MYFETTYTIDTRDLDCFNLCRASAILGYLQDAAGLAAAGFGASSFDMVKNHRHCWMVTRAAYSLDRALGWGDELTVKTWHRGGDRPLMFRDFDLLSQGKAVGRALSVWVLVDLESRSITRPSRFPEFEGTDGGGLIRDSKLPKLKLPADLAAAGSRDLYYSDTDGNGHVNNTRYADFLCDALELEKAAPGAFVRHLQVDYLKECRAGETLELSAGREGEVRYVLGRDSAGEDRFHAGAVF